jgi:hypothetical protein
MGNAHYLPQSALPKVPGRRCQGMAGRPPSRAAAGALFPCRLHLSGPVADIAYQNQSVVYDLLLKTAAETLITIAADPKHLGAQIGLTAVLHTWGPALTHHPHAHIIVPGGASHPLASTGLPADPASFCPCGCSHASSAACSWKG